MRSFDGAAVIEPGSDIHWTELDGIVVMVDERTGELHQLNPTASIVWQCLDGRSSLEEIASDIAEVAGADPEMVLSDIVALATDLDSRSVLAGSAEPAPPVENSVGVMPLRPDP